MIWSLSFALERIGGLGQGEKQFGAFHGHTVGERRQRAAPLDPVHRVEIHLRALVVIAAFSYKLGRIRGREG